MTLNELQRALLVAHAVRTVGDDGNLEQMKAVCYVLRNRVRAGWHDGSWLTVIEESADVAGNELTGAKLRADDRRMAILARDIDAIVYGQESPDDELARVCAKQDKERGPIFYFAFIHREIKPWFRTMIIGNPTDHRDRGQIGYLHLFE